MKPKIIIADDSQTIQKVIKITLANEDYELIECLDYANLNDQIESTQADIVLLDFNFSENKTGYDIAKEIREKRPQIKFMMLYGTFDTIDEELLDVSGVTEHIVKPFDGTKFITSCRQLVEDISIESDASMEDEFPAVIEEVEEEIVEASEEEEDFDEQWIVNQPTIEESEEELIQEKPMIITGEEMNSLERNMQDWGMEVPGIIGEEDNTAAELPPVIGEISSDTDFVVEGHAMPSDDDLDFPDPEAVIQKVQEEVESNEGPQLTPLSSLNETPTVESEVHNEIEFDTDEVGASTEEEISNIESQIADEAEEDLWQADEVHEGEEPQVAQVEETNSLEEEISSQRNALEEAVAEFADVSPIKPHQLEEVSLEDFNEVKMEELDDTLTDAEDEKVDLSDIPSDFPSDVMSESTPSQYYGSSLSDQDLEAKIESMVTPIIERVIKETIEKQFQDSANKVAWEVIPDLAENLIKKELKSISDKILNSKH